jgi:GT2 family glycosyltransferase
VEVIENERNLGFAEGNNVGLRRALDLGADYALLLNNDTIADPDAIGELVAEARRRPKAGALSPLVYFADPPDVIWYAGAPFDPSRGHQGPHAGYRERDHGQYDEPRRVGYASGAAVLVPRAVLEDVGLLDADLFLLVEDAEWSLRMLRAGYELWFVPAARVWHRVSIASGGEHSATIAYYHARNMLEVCDRYAESGALRSTARHAETLIAQLLHTRRAHEPLANARALLAGWRDYRRGLLGPRDALVASGVRARNGAGR